ncbi:DUF4861 family protein [uncultured Duncaniella sp.]|uniref:DUF4861 family protein n=1 Tax=uncultured Duncaniella sp. TaxID=2768039 RepID=UPI0025F3F9C7|nr:DUF4861 family protein [uncultured Duncaniella sp.]
MGYADPTDNPSGDNGDIFVGLVVPRSDAVPGVLPLPEPAGQASGHILVRSEISSGEPYTYYWGSGWSKAAVKNLDEWKKVLVQSARSISFPLEISVNRI